MLKQYPHVVIAFALLAAALIVRRPQVQAAPALTPAPKSVAWEYALMQTDGLDPWWRTADVYARGPEAMGKALGVEVPAANEDRFPFLWNVVGSQGWQYVETKEFGNVLFKRSR